MKIIIEIDQSKFEKTKVGESIIEEMHDNLCQDVDKETSVQYKYDGDKDEDDENYNQDAEDFIDDELCRGLSEAIPFTLLKEDDPIAKVIINQVDRDAYRGYGNSNGSFVNMTKVALIKFKDPDRKNELVIRLFAHVESGIQDEEGTDSQSWDTSSIWTTKGEFIKHFD